MEATIKKKLIYKYHIISLSYQFFLAPACLKIRIDFQNALILKLVAISKEKHVLIQGANSITGLCQKAVNHVTGAGWWWWWKRR